MYPNLGGAMLPQLNYAEADAKDFREHALKVFALDNIGSKESILLTPEFSNDIAINPAQPKAASQTGRPTVNNMRLALNSLSNTTVDDTVVLFYTGHGLSIDNGYAFLLQDSTYDSAHFENVVRWSEVFDAIKATSGRRIIVLDTCHASGVSPYNMKSQDLGEEPVFSFLASDAGHLAYEGSPPIEHGIFTQALIFSFKGGWNPDKTVLAHQLKSHVDDEVKKLDKRMQPDIHFPAVADFVPIIITE
jgi:uncharacterized caspase-like protein